MKKRNFVHRLVHLVERELEATLAVLIVLAAVVGYSLAATEASPVSPAAIKIAQTGSDTTFAIGGGNYQTIGIDPAMATSTANSVYRVRNFIFAPDAPTDIINIRNIGASGANPDLRYEMSIALNGSFAGSLYVWGSYPSGALSVNGTLVASPSTSVAFAGNKITLNFQGGSDVKIKAISTVSQSSANSAPKVEPANIAVIPSITSIKTSDSRAFVALVTSAEGKAINSPVAWSITNSSPANIATINPTTGEVTANKVGSITVTASVKDGGSSITASATVTIIDEPNDNNTVNTSDTTETNNSTDEGKTPAEDTTDTTEVADAGKSDTETDANSWNTDWGVDNEETDQTILDTLRELIAGSADAATNQTKTTAPAPKTIVEAITSPVMAAERIKAGAPANPTQAEINTATAKLSFTQKVAVNVQIGFKQVASDLREIAVGSVVKDATGKTIAQKPSAVKALVDLILDLTGGNKGTNAGTTKIEVGGEGDVN